MVAHLSSPARSSPLIVSHKIQDGIPLKRNKVNFSWFFFPDLNRNVSIQSSGSGIRLREWIQCMHDQYCESGRIIWMLVHLTKNVTDKNNSHQQQIKRVVALFTLVSSATDWIQWVGDWKTSKMARKNWSFEEIQGLIAAVKRNPSLYDRRHPDYNLIRAKEVSEFHWPLSACCLNNL